MKTLKGSINLFVAAMIPLSPMDVAQGRKRKVLLQKAVVADVRRER